MQILRNTLIAVIALAGAGCIASFKPEIQQGNVITQEMVDKLKPGMTKSQVRFVLGTPLINDPFHPERWDYIHVYKKDVNAAPETHQFTVFFEGDALARVEGEMPMTPAATAVDNSSGTSTEQSPVPPSTAVKAL